MAKRVSKKFKRQFFFFFLIVLITICLGIGYAEITAVDLRVSSNTSLIPEKGIIITDVIYESSNNCNPDNQEIIETYQSLMKSKIVLGNDLSSSITYRVRLKNTTDDKDAYDQAVYTVGMGYDNTDIVFEVAGINHGDVINPGETKELTITFKYKR